VAESGERRMVFDVRGRRKHVVRVVYAILAVLMGASLFLVVGPFNLSSLVGGGGVTSAAKIDQEQVQKIEEKLRRQPKDEALLLALTRAHVIAAGALSETNPETGLAVPTTEAVREYSGAVESWASYLKQTDEPNPSTARAVAETYIKMAEVSGTIEESNANIAKAAKTQRIAAAAQPTLGSLSLLATYEYFAGNYSQGDKAAAEATRKTTKTEAKEVTKKLAATRARAKQFEKEVREFAKTEKEKGKEALKNPFGGLGGSPSLGG
jgi:hypothetical protein